MQRFILTILSAWLVFIGIDFFFHASVFKSIWAENISGIKPLDDLALLIPAGYGSFLLLTVLIGYLFHQIFKEKPNLEAALKFALVFGLLFSLSNLLGLLSYVAIPFKYLAVFNLVYLMEIFAVVAVFHFAANGKTLRKIFLNSLLVFVLLVIAGIIIQNILQNQ